MLDTNASSGQVAFNSASSIARWVVNFLIAHVVLGVIAIISGLMEMGLLAGGISSGYIGMSDAIANDERQQLIGILQLLLFFPTATFFVIWFYRAYRNLSALGVCGLSFSPGWATAGYFIPLLNLGWPYVVMRELWKASHPGVEVTDGTEWKSARLPSKVGLWWCLYIGSNLLGQAASRIADRVDTLDDIMKLSGIMTICDLMLVTAATFLISIVRNIDRWQEERAADLNDPLPSYYQSPPETYLARPARNLATGPLSQPQGTGTFQVRKVTRNS